MIRDPSDGTVREALPPAPGAKATSAPAMPGPDTGVRQPTKTDAMMRLEFSREWLKNYHAKKYRKAIDDADSMTDKGDVP